MWLESSSLGAQVMLNSRVEMLNSLKFDGDVCWLGPMKQGSWISEFDPFPCFLSAFFFRVLISTGRGARWGGGARVYAWSPRLPQAGAVSAGWPRSSLAWADWAELTFRQWLRWLSRVFWAASHWIECWLLFHIAIDGWKMKKSEREHHY